MRKLSPPPSKIMFGTILDKTFSNSYQWITWLFDLHKYVKIEAWHEVGASGEPAFQNSWANVGGSNDETLGYRLEGNRKLHLKGYIDSGTTTDGTVIFTLPSDYRPIKEIRTPTSYTQGGAEHFCEVEILTNGDVTIYGVSGGAPALSLHTIVDIDNG